MKPHVISKVLLMRRLRLFTPRSRLGALAGCLWLAVAAAACADTTTSEPEREALTTAARALNEEVTCVILQRGAHGQVQDAHISSHQPDHNAGGAPEAYVGEVGKHQRQFLLRFDTNAIPPEALVTSATLRLWRPQAALASSLGLHAITADWKEDSVTWANFGAAFVPHAATWLNFPAHRPGAFSTDLTSLVRSWVRNPQLNQGILLQHLRGHSLLASSESPHLLKRPSLEVCYSLPGTAPQSTSLLLRVLDSTGAPMRAAVVTLGGSLHPTDGAGYLFVDELPPGRFLAPVEAPGFAPATVSVELREGLHAGAQVRLLPLGPPLPFSVEEGATLERDGVRISIPPHAVIDLNGQPVSGTVELTIVPLDPTQSLTALPGPLEGVTATSGEQVPLESYFMAELSLWRDGIPLQLAPGASAVVEFLLPESAARGLRPGDSVPAWWFDLDAGLWREEGAGLVQSSQTHPGRLSWVMEVSHFTWWNADAPWGDRSCVRVLVQDNNGLPIANLPVSAVGTSYTGLSRPIYTGPDGRACVDIKKGGTANIFAGLPGTPASPGVSVTGSTEPAACVVNGANCSSVTLTVPIAPMCIPGSFRDCDYSGNRDDLGRGICVAARQRCGVLGLDWSVCNPDEEVLPAPQDFCTTPFDDDCDGDRNENCHCALPPNPPNACYTGPPETDNVGRCRRGTEVCNTEGEVIQCADQILPGAETCATQADDDCNGSTECDDLIDWGRRFGDAQCQEAWGVAADSDRNIVVTGWLAGSADFGGGSLSSTGRYDVFVAKLTPQGNHLWSQTFSGANHSMPVDVAVDAAGNVFVAVMFDQPLQVAGQTFWGWADSLVVKLSPAGQLLWATQVSGPRNQEARGLALTPEGNVLVTGIFNDVLTVGSLPSVSPRGSLDSFVLKLNGTTGTPEWVRGHGGTGTTVGWRVAADAQGNAVVAGGFSGSATFGSETRVSAGSFDAFVVTLDKDTGNELWVSAFGNTADQFAMDVAVNSSNEVVFTGYFYEAMSFGGLTLGNAGEADGFLVRLDASGGHSQSMGLGGPGDDVPLALALNGSGGVLLSGLFTGTSNFGGGPRSSTSNVDFFLARYDASFQHLWSKGYAGQYNARLDRHDLAFDGSGQALFAGGFQGTVDLGQGIGTLTSQGCGDALLLKIKAIP